MKSRAVAAALSVLALAAGAATIGGPAAGAAVPVPEKDAFYAVPANIATKADGTVLASRSIAASSFGIPLPARAWQVKYRTTDSEGNATATVTTILVPLLPWTKGGPRPLVSYQTAEDGVAGKCAPSYALRAGLQAGPTNSNAETGLMALALFNGWAVAAPDYEGPNSAFLGTPGEARAVLDGVRAAKHFAAAGLSNAPTALWGYSGGSIASSAAAQLQTTYAPDVHLAGVALGGLVADIPSTIHKFEGLLGGAIPMGVNGVMRAYPDYHLEQYLNAQGKARVAATAGDCINDAVARYPGTTIAQIEAFPGAFDQPVVQNLLEANSPGHLGGVPQEPVYDYHSVLDELAPIGPDRDLMRSYCAAGVQVQHVESVLGEHILETITGAPGAIAFLSNRFAGRTPQNTCASIPK